MRNRIKRYTNLLRFLYIQRIKGFTPPGDEPHMDPPGVDRFRNEISKATNYVEFGSGGSTVLVDRKHIRAISVENDRFFARAVSSRLTSGMVRLIVVNMGLTVEWGFPHFPSERKARDYVTAPWTDKGAFPDFILVDGRYRVACALESARRAHAAEASAVLMFDDYASRPYYHAVENLLGEPEMAGRAAIFRIGPQDIPASAVEPWLKDPR